MRGQIGPLWRRLATHGPTSSARDAQVVRPESTGLTALARGMLFVVLGFMMGAVVEVTWVATAAASVELFHAFFAPAAGLAGALFSYRRYRGLPLTPPRRLLARLAAGGAILLTLVAAGAGDPGLVAAALWAMTAVVLLVAAVARP